MLSIKDLRVKVKNKEILNKINLNINKNEIHAIMGPNGSGKSSLAATLAGKPNYEITQGQITFLNQDITNTTPEERAAMGLFLSFQYPTEIPGVTTINFLKTAINQIRKKNNLPNINALEFLQLVKDKAKLLDINQKLLSRSLNENFSGGEKKKNEILQMAILEPKLAILDETDSGLDIDALKTIGNTLKKLKTQQISMIIITHYPKILEYIQPNHIHILHKGQIIKSGDKTLATKLEKEGYQWIK